MVSEGFLGCGGWGWMLWVLWVCVCMGVCVLCVCVCMCMCVCIRVFPLLTAMVMYLLSVRCFDLLSDFFCCTPAVIAAF